MARFSLSFYANSFMVRKTSRAGVLNKNRVSVSCINKKIDTLTSHIQDNPGLSHPDIKGSQTSLRAPSGQILQFLLLGGEVSSCFPLSLELRTVSLLRSFFLTDRTWPWWKAFVWTSLLQCLNLATLTTWGLTWPFV